MRSWYIVIQSLVNIYNVKTMKITIRQLRRIIREALEEQGWVPGRWYPGSGEPVGDEDVERMGNSGFLELEELGEDDTELEET